MLLQGTQAGARSMSIPATSATISLQRNMRDGGGEPVGLRMGGEQAGVTTLPVLVQEPPAAAATEVGAKCFLQQLKVALTKTEYAQARWKLSGSHSLHRTKRHSHEETLVYALHSSRRWSNRSTRTL